MRLHFFLAMIACGSVMAGAEPPKEWVDKDTGHRVVRLTEEPGSASLYFNQNGYTTDGKEMVFTTPKGFRPSTCRHMGCGKWRMGRYE